MKYWYITAESSISGHNSYVKRFSEVTTKHPVDFHGSSFNFPDGPYHVLFSIEITKEQYDKWKDIIA